MHTFPLATLSFTGPPEQDGDTGTAPTPSPSPSSLGAPLSSCRGNEEDHGHGGRGRERTRSPFLPHCLPQVRSGMHDVIITSLLLHHYDVILSL